MRTGVRLSFRGAGCRVPYWCWHLIFGRAEDAGGLAQEAFVLDKKLEAAEALDLYLAAEKLQPENVDVLVEALPGNTGT